MSDPSVDDERSESYLEIQMDRSTIVLAAIGLLVLLAGAFLLGSWFGSRPDGDQAAAAASAPQAEDLPAEHDGEDVVVGESGFGGRPVTAQGAPPVGAVPPPSAGSRAPGPSETIAEELVPAPKATSSRATAAAPKAAARASAAKATAPKATASKATAPPATTSASAASAGEEWIIQVAAAKDRADAEALAGRLRKKGWDVRLRDEGGFVKVHVGPFTTRSAAQAAEQRLKREERLSTWLKRA